MAATSDVRDQSATSGRPRSEAARRAVLHAVDDLLVEVGYSSMTMKGIAERAGVGRGTVYRWWSSKAEILLEAVVEDASEELATAAMEGARDALLAYLAALSRFLTVSPSGLAYCALVGEAQHDLEVRKLLGASDPVAAATHAVLEALRPQAPGMPRPRLAAAQLAGPVISEILLNGTPLPRRQVVQHVGVLLTSWLDSATSLRHA